MVIVFATCWGERDSAAGLSPGWGWEPGSTRSALAGVSQRQRRAARWWRLCRQDEATGHRVPAAGPSHTAPAPAWQQPTQPHCQQWMGGTCCLTTAQSTCMASSSSTSSSTSIASSSSTLASTSMGSPCSPAWVLLAASSSSSRRCWKSLRQKPSRRVHWCWPEQRSAAVGRGSGHPRSLSLPGQSRGALGHWARPQQELAGCWVLLVHHHSPALTGWRV